MKPSFFNNIKFTYDTYADAVPEQSKGIIKAEDFIKYNKLETIYIDKSFMKPKMNIDGKYSTEPAATQVIQAAGTSQGDGAPP
jgi:hypothetical protein